MKRRTVMDELDLVPEPKPKVVDPDQASFFEPFQRHSETSREAADAIRGKASKTLRAKVYRAIVASGDRGMTDPELQAELGLTGSTQRPRRVRLVELGLVIDSGKCRASATGRRCTVWVWTAITT